MKNAKEIENGKFLVLLSHNVPVAAFNTETLEWYQTNTYTLTDTFEHIMKWYNLHGRTFIRETHIVGPSELLAMAS